MNCAAGGLWKALNRIAHFFACCPPNFPQYTGWKVYLHRKTLRKCKGIMKSQGDALCVHDSRDEKAWCMKQGCKGLKLTAILPHKWLSSLWHGENLHFLL